MLGLRKLAVIAPVGVLLMALHQVPLHNPDPIAVPDKVTPEQEVKAIKAALIHRQWLVTSIKGDEIDATLQQNEYSVRIAVTFDAKTIRLRYVDSTNLRYENKNGTELIHKNYPGWISNVVNDIQSNLVLFGS